MFCPQCQAEYRQGITECADCQVPLVPSLPSRREAVGDSGAAGPIVPLWAGEDLALHTSLLEELDAAGIRYFSKPMGAFPGSRKGNPFPIDPVARFGYQVAVLSSNLPHARAILEKLLDDEPEDMELPEHNDPVEAIYQSPASADEKPIMEVWSGTNEEFAGFLQDALRENAILLRAESAGSESRVFVRPSDVPRAKEILRELVEGAPPQ